ncbi:hypothetical protein N2W52_001937 [Clostridium perfringens]|nr:hypothetical protein [Clostridium perfringens]
MKRIINAIVKTIDNIDLLDIILHIILPLCGIGMVINVVGNIVCINLLIKISVILVMCGFYIIIIVVLLRIIKRLLGSLFKGLKIIKNEFRKNY